MTIADFEARVKRVLRRGTVYDDDIPTYVQDAVLSLENGCNWRHMWRESFEQTLTAADSQIVFTGTLKDARYLRFHVPTTSTSVLAGQYAYARKAQPTEITTGATFTSLHQARYWLTLPNTLQLNGAFSEDVLYDIGWYLRSSYDDNLPWLTIAPSVLLAQTLIEMNVLLRDDKMLARAVALYERTYPLLMESDLVHQYDSDDSRMVPFFDELEEDLFSSNEGGLSS